MAFVRSLVLVTAVTILLIKGLLADCPGGWESWGGNCYVLQRTAVEQPAALAFCGLYNATLVSVSSTQEYVSMRPFLRRVESDVDDSGKTRPPLNGPNHSPPTLVPQKTPATLFPATTSASHATTTASPHAQPATTSTTTTPRLPVSTPRPPVSTPVGTSSRVDHRPRSTNARPTSGLPLPTEQANSGSDAGLSSGAVAGIVISVLLVMAAGAAAAFVFVRHRRGHPGSPLYPENSNFSNPMFDFGSTT